MEIFGVIYLSDEELGIYADPLLDQRERQKRFFEARSTDPNHQAIYKTPVSYPILWALTHIEHTTALSVALRVADAEPAFQLETFREKSPGILKELVPLSSLCHFSLGCADSIDHKEFDVDLLCALVAELEIPERLGMVVYVDSYDMFRINNDYESWNLTKVQRKSLEAYLETKRF